MPCYRCDRVQTDPVKGASPWAIAVIERDQVLVCPDCQRDDPNWTEPLATCPHCGSTRLRVMIGSIICRSCGKDS